MLRHSPRVDDGELGVLHRPQEVDEKDCGRDNAHRSESGQHVLVVLLVHAYNPNSEEERKADHVGHQLLQFIQ